MKEGKESGGGGGAGGGVEKKTFRSSNPIKKIEHIHSECAMVTFPPPPPTFVNIWDF